MFVRVRSVIFSLIKEVRTIRSLSCKNPFCATVSGLRFSKASEEQIPTAIREETTKRVNCHKSDNLPLFCIEKDTRGGVLYAPFACVLMVYPTGLVRPRSGGKRSKAERYVISTACRVQTKRAVANSNRLKMVYPTGLEPATVRIGIWNSIQLRYGYAPIYYTAFLRNFQALAITSIKLFD